MDSDSTKDQTDLTEAQAVLDREQVAFLGSEPERARLTAWFNACLNSACGPVGEKYGDVAVWGLLQVWTATVAARIPEGLR